MLDPGSRLPLYFQLETELRRAIESGTWAAHEAIPPERELIAQYGVSRITVRQALSNLVGEGLLYRKHGKGTFVAGPRTGPIAESLGELTGHLEELQLQGLHPEVEVLALQSSPLPLVVAEALRRSSGALGWYLYRRVWVDKQPLMLSTVWLPRDLGIELTTDLVKHETLSRLMTRHGHQTVKGLQRIGAACATAEEAHLLGIGTGEAVLWVSRVIMGAADHPLVWFRTLYRADRYEYEVELIRRRS